MLFYPWVFWFSFILSDLHFHIRSLCHYNDLFSFGNYSLSYYYSLFFHLQHYSLQGNYRQSAINDWCRHNLELPIVLLFLCIIDNFTFLVKHENDLILLSEVSNLSFIHLLIFLLSRIGTRRYDVRDFKRVIESQWQVLNVWVKINNWFLIFPIRHEERKACLFRLIKMFRENTPTDWDEHFKTLLFLLLETMGDNEVSGVCSLMLMINWFMC